MAKEKDFLRGVLVPRLEKRSDSRLFAKRFHETLCELMGSDGIDPAMCHPNLQDLVSMTIAVADAKGYKNIEGCVDAMPVAFTALADDDVRQMDVPEGLGVDVEAWCEGPDPELADVSSHRLMSLLGRPCLLTLPPDMRPTFVDVHGDEISPTCIVTHPAALDMSRTGTDHTWVVAYDPKRSNSPAVTVVPNATAPFGRALENAMAQMTEKVAARKMTMGKDFQAPGMLADVMSPSLAAPRALSDQEGRYYRLMEESVGEIGRWDANLMAFTTNLLLHLELADELSERAALRAAVEEERTRSADMAQEMEREHEARVSALEARLDRSQMECDHLRKELERSDRDLQGALAETLTACSYYRTPTAPPRNGSATALPSFGSISSRSLTASGRSCSRTARSSPMRERRPASASTAPPARPSGRRTTRSTCRASPSTSADGRRPCICTPRGPETTGSSPCACTSCRMRTRSSS